MSAYSRRSEHNLPLFISELNQKNEKVVKEKRKAKHMVISLKEYIGKDKKIRM